jgi:tRNA 2-selenouridine synthase SelU
MNVIRRSRLIGSDLRRAKRRSNQKMLKAIRMYADATAVLQNAANDLAREYERLGMTRHCRMADNLVNDLRDKHPFNLDGRSMLDILSDFNALPEDM